MKTNFLPQLQRESFGEHIQRVSGNGTHLLDKIASLESEVTRLKEELEKVDKEMSKMAFEHDGCSFENSTLKEEVKRLQGELEQKEHLIKVFDIETANFRDDVEEKDARINEQDALTEIRLARIAELEKDLSIEKRFRLEDAASNNDDMYYKVEANKKLQERIKELEAENEQLKGAINTVMDINTYGPKEAINMLENVKRHLKESLPYLNNI